MTDTQEAEKAAAGKWSRVLRPYKLPLSVRQGVYDLARKAVRLEAQVAELERDRDEAVKVIHDCEHDPNELCQAAAFLASRAAEAGEGDRA